MRRRCVVCGGEVRVGLYFDRLACVGEFIRQDREQDFQSVRRGSGDLSPPLDPDTTKLFQERQRLPRGGGDGEG